MKVWELIENLQKFRAEAEVTHLDNYQPMPVEVVRLEDDEEIRYRLRTETGTVTARVVIW